MLSKWLFVILIIFLTKPVRFTQMCLTKKEYKKDSLAFSYYFYLAVICVVALGTFPYIGWWAYLFAVLAKLPAFLLYLWSIYSHIEEVSKSRKVLVEDVLYYDPTTPIRLADGIVEAWNEVADK